CNPWMAIHPPVLFLGYALAVLPFARAAEILVTGDFTKHSSPLRRDAVLITAVLGAGIFLGCVWAYETLGWGGFWGWDPVENSSLVPWLLAVALVHGLVIHRRGGGWQLMNLFLSISVFVLVLFSAFLTRSGLLSSVSVHSFGQSALALPLGFLTGLSASAGCVFFLYGRKKFPQVKKHETFREIVFGTGITALIFFAFVLLFATMTPLFTMLSGSAPATIKTGFYNSISLVFSAVFLVTLATSLHWKRNSDRKGVNLVVFTVVSLSVMAGAVWGSPLSFWLYAAALASGSVIAVVIFIARSLPGREKLPSMICHAGFALFVAGCVGMSVRSDAQRADITAGKGIDAAGEKISFAGIADGKKKGAFLLDISSAGKTVRAEIPFERLDDGSMMSISPYIRHGIYSDLYIYAEGYLSKAEIQTIVKEENIDAEIADTIRINIAHKRLMTLVWAGMALAVIGGLCGAVLFRRRKK
ncbi:MAG: cytochrome c biogenesis protein CcsA, partial [Spirochaetota bacterium]